MPIIATLNKGRCVCTTVELRDKTNHAAGGQELICLFYGKSVEGLGDAPVCSCRVGRPKSHPQRCCFYSGRSDDPFREVFAQSLT